MHVQNHPIMVGVLYVFMSFVALRNVVCTIHEFSCTSTLCTMCVVHMHVRVRVCVCVSMLYMYIYVCVCVCMCVCAHILCELIHACFMHMYMYIVYIFS